MGFFRKLFRWLFGSRKTEHSNSQSVKRATTPDIRASKRNAREEADILRDMKSLPSATVDYVQDGDSVIVSIGTKKTTVRLDSIDCPESDQPWGSTAHAGLIKLIGGRLVRLEEHGFDDHGRTLATLYFLRIDRAEWVNVNERMLLLGHAWVMNKYFDHLPKCRQDKLFRLQKWARSRKVGLWATTNPIPPWRWRSAKRELNQS